MLPKQLKDSQRHQRQPKQVDCFCRAMSLLPQIPGPMFILMLFSSILTMTKFGRIVVLKVAFYTSIWSVNWTHWILIQGIIWCNYDLISVLFHAKELHVPLAWTYFLLMLSVLISYPSGIRHHQLKKVCIQTHQWECMSWNTLSGVTGQSWEMLYLCDR